MIQVRGWISDVGERICVRIEDGQSVRAVLWGLAFVAAVFVLAVALAGLAYQL